MDINQAVRRIEQFLETYQQSESDFTVVESQIVPSGDEQNTVKIWLNFGPDVAEDQLEPLRTRFVAALKQALPDVAGFDLAVRVDAF